MSITVVDAATPTLTKLAEWPGYGRDGIRGMVVTNGTAYLAASDAGLICVDVSNPGEMVRVGGMPPGPNPDPFYDVAVRGNHAFVAANRGLRVIDITNPRAPVQVAQTNSNDSSVAIAVDGDLVVIGDYSGEVEFFDISNPSTPRRVSSAARIPARIGYKDLAAYLKFAFLADGTTGLTIVDYFNPTRPTRLRGIDTPGSAGGIAVDGSYAYLADGSTGLLIFDISGLPAMTQAIATYATAAPASQVILDHDRAIVGMGSKGIELVDVREPKAPVRLGGHTTLGTVMALAAQGSQLFVGHNDAPLEAVDLSDPSAPKVLGRLDVSSKTGNIAVRGANAFVADGGEGLRIFDIGDLRRPVLRRTMGGLGNVRQIALSGDLAVVAAGLSGVQILNVTNPLEPVVLGGYDTPGDAQDLVITNSLVFVADGKGGLRILDISEPKVPKELAAVADVYASGVALKGPHALVAGDLGGLVVVDVADPTSPKRLGPTRVRIAANSIVIYGDLGFATGSSTVDVLDLKDVLAPVVLNRIPAFLGQRVAYDGRYAYVVASQNGLSVYDLLNPSSPVRVGEFKDSMSFSTTVTVQGRTILVSESVFGLKIFDFGEPRVIEPPRLEIGWAGGLPQITLAGTPGAETSLLFREELEGGAWQTLTNVTLIGDRTVVTDPSPVQGRRYYRAQSSEAVVGGAISTPGVR